MVIGTEEKTSQSVSVLLTAWFSESTTYKMAKTFICLSKGLELYPMGREKPLKNFKQ